MIKKATLLSFGLIFSMALISQNNVDTISYTKKNGAISLCKKVSL
jgi:hypothetical protein